MTELGSKRYRGLIVAAFGLLAATLIGLAIEEWVWPLIAPDQSPLKIAIVGPETGQGQDFWREVTQGVKDALTGDPYGRSLRRDLDIELEPYDDEGSAAKAVQIAEDLVRDGNVLAVIGPATSTAAHASLPVYREHGLPVVLPTATNPDLLHSGDDPILRLPPTDDQQTETLVKLACGLGERSTAMVLLYDLSNSTYSKYIAGRFVELIERGEDCPSIILEKRFERGEGLYVTAEMLSFEPSVALFIGEGEIALQLLRQARALDWKPTFLFTDSSVHSKLSLEPPQSPAYAAFPSVIADPEHPSPHSYGYDALALLARQTADLSKKSLDRKELSKRVARLRGGDPVIIERSGQRVQYRFDEKGNNTSGEFRIWKLDSSGSWAKQDD